MKRILFIFFLCLVTCALNYNACSAQQSGYGQEEIYGESAQTRAQMGDSDSLIPEISAPVELWIFVGNYRFVTGKQIHLTLQMIWKLGVNVNVEEFRGVDLSPFKIEEVTIGEREIFNNDCDFRIITYILSLPDDAKEGVYTIPSFSISYKDEVNKDVGQVNTSPIALKKVPIMLDAKVDRDVVDIGDRIHYELTMWHERYVKILKKNMEKPDFDPFQLIDFNVVEESEGILKKTTMEYEISIYDLPGKKESFEIPSLPVLYYLEHEGEPIRKEEEELIVTQELVSPAIPVLVNSLLKRIDVPLESVKGPVVHSRRDICLRGHLPIIFGVIIIIVLGVNEIRRYASRFTKVVKEKMAGAPLAHAEKLEALIADFNPDAEANELRKSVISIDCGLRVFLGALAEISREEALSFTTTKIVDTLGSKNMAGKIVESANNTLGIFDSVIFGDINKVEIEKAVNEVREILEDTRKRGYY
jgi:hypothetical protein